MSRKIGDQFEKRVRQLLRQADFPVEETVNSGAAKDDGDIRSNDYLIECKNQASGVNAIIKDDEFQKVTDQATRYCRIPILALRSGKGREYAVLDLSIAIQLLKRLYDAELAAEPNPLD